MPLIDWNTALKVWSIFMDFPHSVTVPQPVASFINSAATSVEECTLVKSVGELESSAKELNAPVSCRMDGESEDSEVSQTQNSLHGIETLSEHENCIADKDITVSCSNDGSKNSAHKCFGNVLVEHDSVSDKAEEVDVGAAEVTETTVPSFRATCHRSGEHHCFQSPAAAACFGGAVQDYFGWKVDLSNYDIEVVLCIEDRDVRVGISLTHRSLHRRHITHFGKTTLRPTIAHGMLR